MRDTSALWQEIYRQFAFHRKPTDATPQDALDRIAQKCLKAVEKRSFGPANCSVHEELLSRDSLANLVVYHARTHGYPSAAPIVVLASEGDLVVIDGNTRVNRWRESGSNGPFPAIVVTPQTA